MTAKRYRCSDCGNLTRFDVTATTTIRSFYHYDLGGELHIEEDAVLDRSVIEVACRWCGKGDSVEEVEWIPDGETASGARTSGGRPRGR